MPLLGVNIDHIATIRQLRKVTYPDLAQAIKIVESAGADFITAHLREDRRHIQDEDLITIMNTASTWLNLETSINSAMIDIAIKTKPKTVCLVPEKREELTTEGGLDVIANSQQIKTVTTMLHENEIGVSLFIDPEEKQINEAKNIGAKAIEIHTGTYANARSSENIESEFNKIKSAVELGRKLELLVNLGHGLTVDNVAKIKDIPNITEYNIGHSIVADAVFYGLDEAVKRMRMALGL